jgi:hypothetical protein
VERVHTRWPDQPVAAGLLGLGWLGWATHKVGKAGQAGPTAGFWPKRRFQIRNSFSFSNLFYKLQINLNSNQI